MSNSTIAAVCVAGLCMIELAENHGWLSVGAAIVVAALLFIALGRALQNLMERNR